jgi:hypothetical protein
VDQPFPERAATTRPATAWGCSIRAPPRGRRLELLRRRSGAVVKLGHELEVHPVDPGDERRRHEDGRDDGEHAEPTVDPLLLGSRSPPLRRIQHGPPPNRHRARAVASSSGLTPPPASRERQAISTALLPAESSRRRPGYRTRDLWMRKRVGDVPGLRRGSTPFAAVPRRSRRRGGDEKTPRGSAHVLPASRTRSPRREATAAARPARPGGRERERRRARRPGDGPAARGGRPSSRPRRAGSEQTLREFGE